jgi:type I restriction enzyme R subunit
VNDLSKEEKRAAREGLTEEYLVVFDLLEKPNLSSREREKLKKISSDLLEKLKVVIEHIDNWREKTQSQSTIKTEIYNYLYQYLPESYEECEIDEKKEVIYKHFFYNYGEVKPSIYL